MMLMIHIACTEEVNTISNKNTSIKEVNTISNKNTSIKEVNTISNKNTKKNRMSTTQKAFIGLGSIGALSATAVVGYFITKHTITNQLKAIFGVDSIEKVEQQQQLQQQQQRQQQLQLQKLTMQHKHMMDVSLLENLCTNNNDIKNMMEEIKSKICGFGLILEENENANAPYCKENYGKRCLNTKDIDCCLLTFSKTKRTYDNVKTVYKYQKKQGNNIDKSKIKSYQEYQNNVIDTLKVINPKIKSITYKSITYQVIDELDYYLSTIYHILDYAMINGKLCTTMHPIDNKNELNHAMKELVNAIPT